MTGAVVGSIFETLMGLLPEELKPLDDFPRFEELRDIEGSEFYPVSLFVDLTSHVEIRLAHREAMLKLGRLLGIRIIQSSPCFAEDVHSVKEAIERLDMVYGDISRNVYGSWQISAVRSSSNRRTLVLSYNWPYNCSLQEGILLEIAWKFGGLFPEVKHFQCIRDAYPECVFELSWSVD